MHKSSKPSAVVSDGNVKGAGRRLAIVPLGKADFRQVHSVENSGQRRRWTDGMLKDELFHEHGFHFGIKTAAAAPLTAYILCRIFAHELHIHRLCTLPAKRRQGYAAALLSHTLAAARRRGAARAFLEVSASNSGAMALYEQAGFSVDAERKSYYRDANGALLMSRTL